MDSSIYQGLSNLWTFHLTVSGIIITLITVLYSFLLSKKEQWLFYVNEQNTKKSPELIRKSKAAKKYIIRLMHIIKWCFVVLCISVALSIMSICALRLPFMENYSSIIYSILLSITIVFCVFILLLAVLIIKQYSSDTNCFKQ